MLASKSGMTDIVQILIAAGASVHGKVRVYDRIFPIQIILNLMSCRIREVRQLLCCL